MDQIDLERLALRIVAKKLNDIPTTTASIPKSKKDGDGGGGGEDIARLQKLVEDARTERDRLLLRRKSTSNYNITTVGKVVQDRMKLDRKEKLNIDYIKRARGLPVAEEDSTAAEKRVEEKSQFSNQRKEFDQKTFKRSRLLKLGEKVKSFRLAGISCFSVGGRPNDLGLRFDPTYNGHYLDEKFYCILTGKDLSIFRHSLPYFIPIEDLAKAFLPSDPSQFCRRVSRYVCAFAGRKILAEQLMRDFQGKATVDSSVSFDVITLTGRLVAKKNIPVHSVQLKFDSVLELIPNKADVTFLKPNGEMVLQKVILDKIPATVPSARFFNYSIWIKSVLDKRYYEGESSDDEEGEENEGEETQKATGEEEEEDL
jgi:hypothetical protein